MFGDTDARREDLGHVGETVGDAEQGAWQEAQQEAKDVAAPVPPVTGDTAVDDAMIQLARSQASSFAERIESGEHAHRSLQSRLGGLGGA
ncbi:hypothetical protein [Terrabacter sp. 2RAF25]|uniref:hypothetical protein n=1 Tax=Terrabacter sp. 2RAF25 TaxID=3232998 RepID=UPI003F947BDC